MITALDPSTQITDYLPINPKIKEELEAREKDKNRLQDKVPFLRVTCLQEVFYTNDSDENKNKNIVKEDAFVTDENGSPKKNIDGFIFELNSDFDQSYGKRQVVGTELSSLNKIYLKNDRRVPPPNVQSFTATVGEENGYYTTGQLKFTAHSKEQLEFLTPFLLHPGNTVIFEFGHSDKNTTLGKFNNLFSNEDTQEFLNDIIIDEKNRVNSNFFQRLQQKVYDSGGHYEFLVGVINNFDFSLNDNFGFDVTVDVWSITKTIVSGASTNPQTKTNPSVNDEILIENKVNLLRKFISNLETDEPKFVACGSDIAKAEQIVNPNFNHLTDHKDVLRIDTPRGVKKYVKLDLLLNFAAVYYQEIRINLEPVKLHPYLTSFDDSVLFFRNKQPSLSNVKVNEDSGIIDFSLNDIDNGFVPYTRIIPLSSINIQDKIDTIEQIENIDRRIDSRNDISAEQRFFQESLNPLGAGIGFVGRVLWDKGANFIDSARINEIKDLDSRFQIQFESYRPYKIDVDSTGTLGNLGNVYYDAESFISSFKRHDGKIVDTMKDVIDNLNKASNGFWDLNLLETFNIKNEDKDTAANLTPVSFSSRQIRQVNREKTHTFKINQKESITTSLSFDLGLEGLVADQIYFESTNQSNGSMEGTKLNLLLFEKHENGIKLIDKRNKAIQKAIENRPIAGGNVTPSDNAEAIATGSISTFYEENPSKYLSVIGIYESEDVYQGRFEAALKAADGSKNFWEYVEFAGGLQLPLVQDFKEVFQMAMKQSGVLPSKNDEESKSRQNEGINPLLESRLDFNIPGCGGFQPLQFFRTDGLPDIYDKRGDFCIMNVTQTITPSNWTTSLKSAFRVKEYEES